ncbi:MAG: LamG-like jellyroll fold domain-containing protein, partial [Verrucomicrobiota bacterium]
MRATFFFFWVIALGWSASAANIVPGVTKNYEAGVFPDGDDDATWEDAQQTTDFQFNFSGGAQVPIAVNDPIVFAIDRAYLFPAAVANAPSGDTLGSTEDATFEIWFKPDDLLGDHVLFECGGQGSGTAFILQSNQLHFISQSGNNANRMKATVVLPPTSTGRYNQVVGSIDFLGGGAGSIALYLNHVEAGTNDALGASYNGFGGGNGSGLGTFSGNYAGNNDILTGGITPFNGGIAIVRYYRNRVLNLAEVGTNYLAVTEAPPSIHLFSAHPTNITLGQMTLLSWNVSNAVSLVIDPGPIPITNGMGSLALTPSNTTVYTLTASNGAGAVVAHAQVVVDGLILDPMINEFMASNDRTLDDGNTAKYFEGLCPEPFQFSLSSSWSSLLHSSSECRPCEG